jgi:hypothetical protein
MSRIEAIIVDGVRYDKVVAKAEFVCGECELREVCKENGYFTIACVKALSSDDECWKRKEE